MDKEQEQIRNLMKKIIGMPLIIIFMLGAMAVVVRVLMLLSRNMDNIATFLGLR